jgi:hypothetical protein
MYQKVGNDWSKMADGDGEISKTNPFDVRITAGGVQKGKTYQIRQGQSSDGDMFNCKTGAEKGSTAQFSYQSAFLIAEIGQSSSLALRSAVLATEKTVNIEIDPNDLTTLKNAGYRLCFAKKVGNADYNVVWQSYTKYLVYNSFSWTPQYQLFGSNYFKDNVTVRVSTNLVQIGLGETSTLDSAGILSKPVTGGPKASLNLDNQYGTIHPGVNQLSTGIDGSQTSTPIYVAVNPIVLGETSLTPIEKVLVWFEQNIETSTMFSTSRSFAVEIDLTFENEETRLYKDGRWSTPS